MFWLAFFGLVVPVTYVLIDNKNKLIIGEDKNEQCKN